MALPAQQLVDHDAVAAAIRLFTQPGQVVEVRALEAKLPGEYRLGTVSGYFDDPDLLATAVSSITSAKGIYFTINPVMPALLARAANRLRLVWKDPTTSDADILRRRWLPIDADPVRPAGISSTQEEHDAALAVARQIQDSLAVEGWPAGVFADSGNGAHFEFLVDLPRDDDGLVERALKSLALRFDTDKVKIDQTLFNPARIIRLYGTRACKGDSVAGRPHRMSQILVAPVDLVPVPREFIEGLAGEYRATVSVAVPAAATNGHFDLEHWIHEHRLAVTGPDRWKDGHRWVFDTCPWNSDHTNRSAYIVQLANGAISAGCHHAGCAGKGWHDLRDKMEPDWREWRSTMSGGASVSSVSPPDRDFHWPEDPEPLPADLPAVLPFDDRLLPESFRRWVADIAERLQCPPDFPAVAAMIVLAGVVGRRIGIRPKRFDDWLVVPNLWGAVIGRPGVMKSPAIQEPLRSLKRLEIQAKEEYEQELQRYEARELIEKVQRQVAEKQIKSAVQRGEDADQIAEVAVNNEASARRPVRRRYLTNDSTVEKLGEILNENPNGVTVFRDELVGWLRDLDKQGRESARVFYLEAWNGTGRFTYDRIGRGTIDIEAAITSVLGGIQPGPLAEYIRAAMQHGAGDDGLMQRLQLAVWPDVVGAWRNVDRWPDTTSRNAAWEIVKRLSEADFEGLHVEEDGIPFVHFDIAAQRIFDAWRTGLEGRLRSGELHSALESHLAKYRSLVPSLALLIQLADTPDVRHVGETALQKALGWAAYLESHAGRLYSPAIQRDMLAARALAAKLQSGRLRDGFALRDVYRAGWSHLDNREDALAATGVLMDLGWLRATSQPTDGRTAMVFRVHPKILAFAQSRTDKTDKSPLEPPSVSSVSASAGPSQDFSADDWVEVA